MRELLELIFSYIIFPFTLLSHGERKDISPKESQEESIPSWVGGGDLRVALFIGLTLGTLHGIASFAIAYIIGSIVGVILMVS